MAVIREVIRKGVRNLFLIGREKGIDFDLLIGAGSARKVLAAYIGLEEYGLAMNFRRGVESGDLELSEQACASVIAGLRAAATGLPFLPIRGLEGSDLLRVHQDFKPLKCPFTGETLIAIPRLEPDVAVIHAQRGDPYGNVQIRGSRFEDALMVRAAKKAIVSLEEIISNDEIRKNPQDTTIPYFMVDAIIEVPEGAHPTSCWGYYDSDLDHFREYANAARSPAEFQKYLQTYVYNIKDHNQYRKLISRE